MLIRSHECRQSLLFHPPLRQGGDLRLLAAVPWRSEIGGMTSAKSTRNPFMNLWVKAQTGAHPRMLSRSGGFRCRQFNYMRCRCECQALQQSFAWHLFPEILFHRKTIHLFSSSLMAGLKIFYSLNNQLHRSLYSKF